VPTLARGDVERVLRFAGEAESLDGDDPFTEDLLVELGELVQADWITYFERDHLGRHLFEVGRPDEAEAWDGVPVEGWSDATLNGSPLNPHRRNGYLGALRVSDFLSQRELHRTRFYEIGLRPLGVEHTMEIEIPSRRPNGGRSPLITPSGLSASVTGSSSISSSPTLSGAGKPRRRGESWRRRSPASSRLRRQSPAE